MSAVPTKRVLQSFGIENAATPLSGGMHLVYRAGPIVLKRIDQDETIAQGTEEIAWVASVLNLLRSERFRVPHVLVAASGDWIVEGWYAQEWVEGERDTSSSRWPKLIAFCKVFHEALKEIPRPPFLDRRTDPWSAADHIAWGELPPVCYPELQIPVEKLLTLLRPIALASQLIHGDFTGNVLFAEHLPPAVIDFSPYWRPAEFALAVVVVDALVWGGADASILDMVNDVRDIAQMLVRAELRRLFEIDRHHRQRGRETLGQVRSHLDTVDLLCELARA